MPPQDREIASVGIDATVGVAQRKAGMVLDGRERPPTPVAHLSDALGGEQEIDGFSDIVGVDEHPGLEVRAAAP